MAYVKLNKHDKLLLDEQILVDATHYNCLYAEARKACEQHKEECGPDEDKKVAVFTNPAPLDNKQSKVFYGTINRRDLNNATKNCKGGGRATGFTMMVTGAVVGNPGVSKLGQAVFEYSDVSCTAIKNNLEDDNLMTLIGSEQVVGEAIRKKLTHDTLKKIPLLSGEDKRNAEDFVDKAAAPLKVRVDKDKVTFSAGPVKTSVHVPRWH